MTPPKEVNKVLQHILEPQYMCFDSFLIEDWECVPLAYVYLSGANLHISCVDGWGS